MTREEARAKAKEFRTQNPRLFEPESEKESWDKEYVERLMFEANYDEWLELRGAKHVISNEEDDLRSMREDDLMLSLFVAPVPLLWMVFKKFEVLKYYLGKFADDAPSWTERLAVIATAGIKTDLMRLGIGENN